MKLDPRVIALLQGHPGEVTDSTFDALVLQNPGAVVVDFWAEYCSPCHMLMPLVYKLAHEYAGRVTFLKMDTEAHKETFEKYKLRGVPTLLFFLNGKLVDEQVGYGGYDPLREKFEELVANAGLPCTTDTRELAFEAAVTAAEAAFNEALAPTSAAYQRAAEPFREAYEAAVAAADAEREAGRITEEELEAAYTAAYAPMQAATKDEAEAYYAAAGVASEGRYVALWAAIESYAS